MKIKFKFWFYSLFFLGILFISACISLFMASRTTSATHFLIDEVWTKQSRVADLSRERLEISFGLRQLNESVFEPKGTALANAKKSIVFHIANLSQEIDDLQASIKTQSMNEHWETIHLRLQKYIVLASKLVDYASTTDLIRFNRGLSEMAKLDEKLASELQSLSQSLEAEVEIGGQNALHSGQTLVLVVLATSILAIIIGLCAAYWFASGMQLRIDSLKKQLSLKDQEVLEVDEGLAESAEPTDVKTEAKTDVKTDEKTDEFDELAQSFSATVRDLHHEISDLRSELDQAKLPQQAPEAESAPTLELKNEISRLQGELQKAGEMASAASAEAHSMVQSLQLQIQQSQAEVHQLHGKIRATELVRKEQDSEIERLTKKMALGEVSKKNLGELEFLIDRAVRGEFERRFRATGDKAVDELGQKINQLLESLILQRQQAKSLSDDQRFSLERLSEANVDLKGELQMTQALHKEALQSFSLTRSQSAELQKHAQNLKISLSEPVARTMPSNESSDSVFSKALGAETGINDLKKATSEIGQFTKLIASISSQTNLLALNATIEAARAGEAGRGFAIVATEVKELAKQTKFASEKVEEQISSIIAATESLTSSIGKIGLLSVELKDRPHADSIDLQTCHRKMDILMDSIGELVKTAEYLQAGPEVNLSVRPDTLERQIRHVC